MVDSSDNNLKRVSVVVNVWREDDAISFRRSLRSIGRQSHKPDEVLIVVDGPINKNLHDTIEDFVDRADFPVTKTEIPVASGLWNARNVGIHAAKFDLIALHDADDVMHPDRLRIQLNQMGHDDIDVLGSPVYEFDPTNETIVGLRTLAQSEAINKKMIWQNVINHSSVMLRKSAVNSVGGYRNVYLSEDYDLWLRLIYAGKKLSTTDYVLQAFSVDRNLNKRRGGPRFVSSELDIHRLVRSSKSLGLFLSWTRLFSRLAFRLGPGFIRQNYRYFCQSKWPGVSSVNLEEFMENPPLKVNRDL